MFESIIPDWYVPSFETVEALFRASSDFDKSIRDLGKYFFLHPFDLMAKYEALKKISDALWKAHIDARESYFAHGEAQIKLADMERKQREEEQLKKYPPEKFGWMYEPFTDGDIPF